MQVPVVVATTAESPLGAGAQIRTPVDWECPDIIRAHVLAPLPHVAGHVEE
jgi:hypothetical protein